MIYAGYSSACEHRAVQGYLAHKKQQPSKDHHRAVGTVPLQGPVGALFLMSEVPLYLLWNARPDPLNPQALVASTPQPLTLAAPHTLDTPALVQHWPREHSSGDTTPCR